MTGTITTMAANQKLGFADASKSEVNTVALPQTNAPVRRCLGKSS